MKMPKKIRKYCKYCGKYQEMTVSQAKSMGRNKAHPMSWGSRLRMRRRGLDRGAGNKGKTSKGAVSSWKRYGVKSSKKTDLRFKCSVCGKIMVQSSGFRAKRIEIK
mgnify:CR=1 FL=1